jgi:hypothetical protein
MRAFLIRTLLILVAAVLVPVVFPKLGLLLGVGLVGAGGLALVRRRSPSILGGVYRRPQTEAEPPRPRGLGALDVVVG